MTSCPSKYEPADRGLVLGRAAGHDLARGEPPLLVAPLDHHLAALGEHVGPDAAVRNRNWTPPIFGRELEGELVRVRVPAHAAVLDPALHAQRLAHQPVAARDELP